jgi:hypothetical protein
VPVKKFADAFKSFHVGRAMLNELAVPFDKSKSHPAALSTSKYGVSTMELLKAQIDREILLMKRNSFVYIFKAVQVRIAKKPMFLIFHLLHINAYIYRNFILIHFWPFLSADNDSFHHDDTVLAHQDAS